MNDETRFRGAGGTPGGIGEFFAGILMNLHIYFQATSLFGTIVMIVLLAGGIGLIFRALLPHAQRDTP